VREAVIIAAAIFLTAIFPRCWFNEKTTQAGIEALGMKRATSVSDQTTIGHRTPRMHLD
jgi:hypothetical protein